MAPLPSLDEHRRVFADVMHELSAAQSAVLPDDTTAARILVGVAKRMRVLEYKQGDATKLAHLKAAAFARFGTNKDIADASKVMNTTKLVIMGAKGAADAVARAVSLILRPSVYVLVARIAEHASIATGECYKRRGRETEKRESAAGEREQLSFFRALSFL